MLADVVLIGLPGAGKTTIGMAVAEALNTDFIDTDVLVETLAGKQIREIFAEEGESRFRELELDAATDALAGQAVVSLGGGAVMNPAIRQMITGRKVIWLDVCVTTLTRRIGMNKLRPLLLDDLRSQLTKLAAERISVYQQAASCRVDAEGPIDVVVAAVLACLDRVVITVSSDHPYDVIIGHSIASGAAHYLDGVTRTAVLYPKVLATQVAEVSQDWPNPVMIEVPDSELAKTHTVLANCWSRLAEAGLTRSDAVVGFGGGTTTDLAGFVAATYLRGIRYVNITTTVLGMADAGLGGKTGINLDQGKNLVGAFWEPQVVLCDLDYLQGLEPTQVRSGLGEIIKCGFIADTAILDLVSSSPESVCDPTSQQFVEILSRAIKVKADVVSSDFRELGLGSHIGREALNYGHTLGHAIEKLEDFKIPHGFADSIGMVFAAEVASRLAMISQSDLDHHCQILTAVGLPITYCGADWTTLRAVMNLDKKTRGSQLRLVLLDGIGRPKIVANPDESLLAQAYLAIADTQASNHIR